MNKKMPLEPKRSGFWLYGLVNPPSGKLEETIGNVESHSPEACSQLPQRRTHRTHTSLHTHIQESRLDRIVFVLFVVGVLFFYWSLRESACNSAEHRIAVQRFIFPVTCLLAVNLQRILTSLISRSLMSACCLTRCDAGPSPSSYSRPHRQLPQHVNSKLALPLLAWSCSLSRSWKVCSLYIKAGYFTVLLFWENVHWLGCFYGNIITEFPFD